MEKKTSKNILLIIMGVLFLVEIVNLVYDSITRELFAYNLLSLLEIIGVALYVFWLYKMPHGNMLKYAMLLSALSIVVHSVLAIYQHGDMPVEAFPPILAACLLFYVAGRLNRIDQNKYLLPIVALVLLVSCIIEWTQFSTDANILSKCIKAPRHFISVLILMIAYFVRYKEHKEAGLVDNY